MKINKLTISGIGGIRELELNFNSGFNVICGPNGIGKTTILKVIVHAFSNRSRNLKKHAAYENGLYKLEYNNLQNQIANKECHIKAFDPLDHDSLLNVSDLTPYIMFFNENRFIEYTNLTSIPRDTDSNQYQTGAILDKGIQMDNTKGWFGNRYLFGALQGGLSEERMSNLELAKKSFSVLDPSVCFEKVDSSTLDIMLTTKNGTIYFEYLSAGYKSCAYIILGLIKEIEYRFGAQSGKAQDFEGIILIDEIDLHLHPWWQSKLINALKEIFPKAQFIVTTHSPSVLQTLKREEIIPLAACEDGSVCVKQLNLTEYGLQGWTIEEILRDVMEMPETSSELYETTKKAFEEAILTENLKEVKKQYEILQKMLHPDSVIKRMIKIQTAGMEIQND